METNRVSPLDSVSPLALFGGLDDDAWLWLHTEGREHCRFLLRYLPSLPNQAMQESFVGFSGTAALNDGFEIYRLVRDLHAEHARDLLPSHRVLDFGCGWGRVIRFFLRDVEPANLIGIDVNDKAVDVCRTTNRWCRFERCDVFPPAALEAESFDLVYAYSVFSTSLKTCI